ncbi:eukaryotic translation initiation factor 4 gamma 1-like [Sebastes umbrosus]|uniref:eukaryotic translation initiation factor 4 gamma 1-like n=1 Tax=Sebastes umbrosus TaxID=72105 RepID=UPI00189C71B9|nr:eukaryotic translation initiation factor 4 gamma 1-like [Sebastes umbrosus]
MSLSDDEQFSMAEKKEKSAQSHGAEEDEDDDPEQVKTQMLFNRLHSIVNKLTRLTFQELMKQVMDLTIDTEERLKGTVELIFEKAISEPNSSVVYANMCRCLMGLKVPTSDKPGVFVNFRKLLLNRCQKEFEKDQDDDEIFEKKQKEIEAAKEGEECERLRVELQDSRDQAHRRSLGNIKFIGELFKLKMLTEAIMHDCVVKLLKNHNEESLECVCMLLSTIGKDLDFEKAKPRMDQYFNQMDLIIKERKTSSKIRFKLQDILDLRKNNWVPHREDQVPKTIEQIHKEAECAQVAEDEDDNKFVTEQKVEFTTGEETESKEVDEKKVLTGEELSKQLDRLIQDKANNERIRDWAEANLDEQQTASNQFVRALMTSLCQSAIIGDNPYRVDARQIGQRARLLHIYLSDEQKELQALYALQALIVHMDQPPNLLQMFFDILYDEDVIKEEAFHEWEASRDPAEQKGKGVAKRSVTAFFTWLREAEEDEESD